MRGLVRAKFCAPEEILAAEPNDAARTALGGGGGICVSGGNGEGGEEGGGSRVGERPGGGAG